MSSAVPGAQVVTRVGNVIRAVAGLAPGGGTTTQVARASGLTRSTAHRLLSSLLQEGYVDRDRSSSLWFLGPELYVLGALAGTRYDVTEHARAALRVLAQESEESAFFSVRRQGETVCLMREEGSFPIRSFVLHEGKRFPLGVASAGLVILSHLSNSEIDDYLREDPLVPGWGAEHARAALLTRIEETRVRGYALNPGLVVEGSWGMAAAVFNIAGRPEWALSITGVESRFGADRIERLGRLLLAQAHQLTRRMQMRERDGG